MASLGRYQLAHPGTHLEKACPLCLSLQYTHDAKSQNVGRDFGSHLNNPMLSTGIYSIPDRWPFGLCLKTSNEAHYSTRPTVPVLVALTVKAFFLMPSQDLPPCSFDPFVALRNHRKQAPPFFCMLALQTAVTSPIRLSMLSSTWRLHPCWREEEEACKAVLSNTQ